MFKVIMGCEDLKWLVLSFRVRSYTTLCGHGLQILRYFIGERESE
jgi:hypothetical protein